MIPPDSQHCSVSGVVPLRNGKILVSTACSKFGRTRVGPIFRLHPDGSLDERFDGRHLAARKSINFTTRVRFMVEDHEGRIVAGIGQSHSRTSGWVFNIVRLLNNGSLDVEFATQIERILSEFNCAKASARIALLPDRGYLISLFVHSSRLDVEEGFLLWVDDDGKLTHQEPLSKFTLDGVLKIGNPRLLAAVADSTFVIAGPAKGNRSNMWSMVRFHTNSSGMFKCEWALGPYSAKGRDHKGPKLHRITSLMIEPDGSVLAAGKRSLLRIQSDGSMDPDLRIDENYLKSATPSGLARQAGGQIILGTHASFEKERGSLPGLVRLYATGYIDSTFSNMVGMGPRPLGHRLIVAVQSDDAILVAGSFLRCGEYPARSLIRLTPSGALDTTFLGRESLR